MFFQAPETPLKKRTRTNKQKSYLRLDIPLVLDLVGESITKYVSEAAIEDRSTVALEDLAGEITSNALETWTRRLARLRGLTLWDGGVLNEKVAKVISSNCFDFDDLTFYMVADQPTINLDENLASFFSGLRTNTLRSFSALSASHVGHESLLSLNNHTQSLKVSALGSPGRRAH